MKKKVKQKQKPTVKKDIPVRARTARPERWFYFGIVAIVLLSCIGYIPVFTNELLAWDDKSYIQGNPLVYTIDLKDIFSEYVMGNYHPLTILVMAIEYQIFGLNAPGYHAINLLLHLVNTLLVLYAVLILVRKKEIALVASLLFGIHPLHVESVAWAAELKDLLYTLFFLSSFIFYLRYQDDQHKRNYIIALILFLASLLSKAMAASLPVLMILTDYFRGRKINAKTLLEKVPFFILSIVFGVVAIWAQQSEGATDVIQFPLFQRIVFACYGFLTYLVQLLFPLNLSAYYPYPVKSGEDIPAQYYVYLLLFAALAIAVFYSLRFTKTIVFGLGFYAITIFLVLQLLPVGGAIMADRYAYIPSVGIFYLAGEGLYYLWTNRPKWMAVGILFVFGMFFLFKTYKRSTVWHDDITLWNNVIEQHQTIPIAYNNRGHALMLASKSDSALLDFNKAIELNPDHFKAYLNRGTVLMNMNKNEQALKDFDKAIELKPDFESSYISRGNALKNQNKWEEAIQSFNKAIDLKPDFPEAFYSRAYVYASLHKNTEALQDYNKAIELNKNYIEAYLNRGNLYRDISRFDEALEDYEKALELNPAFAIAFFNRGTLYMNRKMNDLALKDFDKAIEVRPDYVQAYLNKANVFMNMKDYNNAIRSYSGAIQYKNNYADAYYGRALAHYYSGVKNAACADVRQAIALGYAAAATLAGQICN